MSNQLMSSQFSEAKGTVVCFPAIDRTFSCYVISFRKKKNPANFKAKSENGALMISLII